MALEASTIFFTWCAAHAEKATASRPPSPVPTSGGFSSQRLTRKAAWVERQSPPPAARGSTASHPEWSPVTSSTRPLLLASATFFGFPAQETIDNADPRPFLSPNASTGVNPQSRPPVTTATLSEKGGIVFKDEFLFPVMTGRAAGGFKHFLRPEFPAAPSEQGRLPCRMPLPKMAKRFGHAFPCPVWGPHIPQAVLDLFAASLRGVHAFVVDFYFFRQAGVRHNDHPFGWPRSESAESWRAPAN